MQANNKNVYLPKSGCKNNHYLKIKWQQGWWHWTNTHKNHNTSCSCSWQVGIKVWIHPSDGQGIYFRCPPLHNWKTADGYLKDCKQYGKFKNQQNSYQSLSWSNPAVSQWSRFGWYFVDGCQLFDWKQPPITHLQHLNFSSTYFKLPCNIYSWNMRIRERLSLLNSPIASSWRISDVSVTLSIVHQLSPLVRVASKCACAWMCWRSTQMSRDWGVPADNSWRSIYKPINNKQKM